MTTVTFYTRHRIGYKTFQLLYYLTYGAFVLSLLHSWFAGTDTAVLETTYLVTGLLVFFLTVNRVLAALTNRKVLAL